MGLEFLRRLIRTHSTEEKAYILEHKLAGGWAFFKSALGEEPYNYMVPTDVNAAYLNEEELDFCGDRMDGPNAAWPWSTDNKVEVWYAHWDKENLRKWAYVMWGVDRLESWEILDKRWQDISNSYTHNSPGGWCLDRYKIAEYPRRI